MTLQADRTLETSLANIAEKIQKRMRALKAVQDRQEVLQLRQEKLVSEVEQLLQRCRERFDGQSVVDDTETNE